MSFRTVCLTAAPVLLAGSLAAQTTPTSQPALLDIVREVEKPGHSSAHLVTEARWAGINRAAGYPYTYLALVAASGSNEVWWISALDSFDAFGKSNTFGSDKPSYQQSIDRITLEDADHINSFSRMQARALPNAGHGTFPDLTKARVYSVLTVRVRPGQNQAFTELTKHYAAIAANAGVVGWRAYEVVAGAPGGTFLIFSVFPSWAAVDANDAAWGKAMAGAGPHLQAAGKLAAEAVMNTEARYFNINPRMSLVSKEMMAADPFWAAR